MTSMHCFGALSGCVVSAHAQKVLVRDLSLLPKRNISTGLYRRVVEIPALDPNHLAVVSAISRQVADFSLEYWTIILTYRW
jgi:hypothetical protein